MVGSLKMHSMGLEVLSKNVEGCLVFVNANLMLNGEASEQEQ